MNGSPLTGRGVFHRVAFPCDLTEARVATRTLRAFLAEHGLDESEQFNCELCLAEACNNAVQYVTPAGAAHEVVAEVLVQPASVELRVTDRTAGFELTVKPERLNPARENGRGIFIIQTLMDDVRYHRGAAENTLVMRKTRTHQQHRPADEAATATLEDARRQLENCQQTISGMARELCFRSESLSAIFRCCTELGRTSDLEGFVKRLLGDLLHLSAADWFVVRLLAPGDPQLAVFTASDPELGGDPLPLASAAGTTAVAPGMPRAATAPGLASAEVAAARIRGEVEFDARRTLAADEPLRAAGPNASGIVQPLLFGDKLLGTLAIGRREVGEPFTALQAEMIRTFSEFMAVQVMNIRHREEQVHARLVAHELEIAHRIQRALLPRTLPQLGGFRLAGNWESARQVGGDFYDAVALGDHSLLLVVGDVMGKGVPAAIFATITRSLLRALAVRSHNPGKLLKRLNELLHTELSSVGMFITAQLVFVDLKRRQLVTASAGHCPVLLRSGDTVRTLGVTGTPLGILPKATYRQQTASFAQPGGLLIYTDGLTEAVNPAGEMFGADRLANWLRDRLSLPGTAEELRDELAAELIRFRGPAALRDDQAFLLLAEDPALMSAGAGAAGATAATEGPTMTVICGETTSSSATVHRLSANGDSSLGLREVSA
jgi:serine phosphatase RsbU (regulator of sigma subunit)/anti-sigma regulatory factor (Ser/Thr protein kinase)